MENKPAFMDEMRNKVTEKKKTALGSIVVGMVFIIVITFYASDNVEGDRLYVRNQTVCDIFKV